MMPRSQSQNGFAGDDYEMATNSSSGDPSKMKSWGFISAKPSEYIVTYSSGEFCKGKSGQGARCWKWPWDTVAIVPTTLKEVIFQANQITSDNVDVRLRGMVLYRIREPLRIYKLINFSYREQAEAKLARMIADMCRSTAKWLVANMGVEECIRRRKEEIAKSLKEEVSMVVSEGPEAWGVEIVTIDIQDIYIQDAELFAAMQANFKMKKAREAKLARIEMESEVERCRIATDKELSRERHKVKLEAAELAAGFEMAEIELLKSKDKEKFILDHSRVKDGEQLNLYKLEQQQLREKLSAVAERERAQMELEKRRALNEESSRALAARLTVENGAGRASLERLFLTEALPEISSALAASLSQARFNVVQSNGSAATSPFQYALTQILDLLQQRLEQCPEEPDV
jgi:flotillin